MSETSIPTFGPADRGYAAVAEVADIAGVKDGAAWLRRRDIPTRTRMYGGKRLTLAPVALVLKLAGAPETARDVFPFPFRGESGWSAYAPHDIAQSSAHPHPFATG